MEADECPRSSSSMIHHFVPLNLSSDRHPTQSVIVAVLQGGEFSGVYMLCDAEFRSIQI